MAGFWLDLRTGVEKKRWQEYESLEFGWEREEHWVLFSRKRTWAGAAKEPDKVQCIKRSWCLSYPNGAYILLLGFFNLKRDGATATVDLSVNGAIVPMPNGLFREIKSPVEIEDGHLNISFVLKGEAACGFHLCNLQVWKSGVKGTPQVVSLDD